jgi:iron-sulfur cluster assembly accessory protein
MSVDTAPAPTSVTLSARAAGRLAQILAGEPAGTFLRVAVLGGGCSGFQYSFDFDTARQDDDVVVERDGARVLIDATSLDFLKGSEIDFVDEMIGAAFKVINPNAKSSCGCGTSFSV